VELAESGWEPQLAVESSRARNVSLYATGGGAADKPVTDGIVIVSPARHVAI